MLRGVVRDTTGSAVAYCTVSILQARDSTIVGGAVSDTLGCYALEFRQAGRYLLRYDHLAFRSHTEAVDIPACTTLDVALEPVTENIGEVVVLAQYTKYAAGKTTVSMVGNPLAENRTVTETLDLIPGVTVREGKVYINGNAVSTVYINDRKASEAELASLFADHVDNIEIQNKAGSAYDATTQGGVLRVKLRKQSSGSFYGNLDAGTIFSPYMENYSLQLPFSFQYKKLNIYNYISGSYDNSTSDQRDYAEYRNEGYMLNTRTQGESESFSISDALSLVYEFNPRHTLGVYGGFTWVDSDPTTTQRTTLSPMEGFDSPQLPEAHYTDYHHGGDIYNRTYQAVVDYKFAIDTLGSRLQFKADFAHQRVGKQYDYTTLEYRTPTDDTPFSTKRLHESYTPITAALEVRADLTKIFTPLRSLEAGLLYNYGQIDNNSVMT